MRILVTNDDGVYSPGIAALAQVASRFGEVRIVAPDVEMSSASQSITASRPVTYKRTPLPGLDAYRVNGTPGDCVMLGTTLWEKVDVVLSGINIGTNLRHAVDAAIAAPLRRQDRRRQGPDGPHPLLVHRRAG